MSQTVFVNREQELYKLHSYLGKAIAGQGQVCFVMGGPGSGKSALVEHFIAQALSRQPQLMVATGTCNAQSGIGDPYLPFREALAMLIGIGTTAKASQGSSEMAARLRMMLAVSVQVLLEVAPDLIGLVVPGASLVGEVGKALAEKVGWTDRLKKQVLARGKAIAAGEVVDQSRIFEQYGAFLHKLSQKTPLILFLDDLHWADDPSAALLFSLGRHIQKSRVLLLGTYRSNEVALGRNGKPHPLEPVVLELKRYQGDIAIDLDGLPELTTCGFVDALVDTEPNRLGSSFRQALYHKTGGHALFTVELLQAMKQRGDLVRDPAGHWLEGDSLNWNTLPARVEGVIESRIARLDEQLREILTIASVEGEVFTAEVIAHVENAPVRDVVSTLHDELGRRHRLVISQGLAQFGSLRLSLHRFVHNLFHDYIYENISPAQRAYLHLDVGSALEALFGNQTQVVAAQLAWHFEEAGIPFKAAAYHLQAGEKARRVSANQEAVKHFRRGLELLEELPDGSERMQMELALQTSLGTTFIATHGYSWWEVRQAFNRAQELVRILDDSPQLLPLLYGQFLYHVTRGELLRAEQEARYILAMSAQMERHEITPGILAATHAMYGGVIMYLGRLAESRQYLEQALSQHDPTRDRELAYQLGHDTALLAGSYLPWVLWFLGYAEQAADIQEQTLRAAEASQHAYSHALATVFASVLQQMLGRHEASKSLAEETLWLSRQRNFPFWVAMAQLLHGSALVHQGQLEEGIAEQREGLARWDRVGMGLALPYFWGWLAESYLVAGRREEGLQIVGESLTLAESTGESWWLPEQHRIQAELLLLAPGCEPEAEVVLRKALEISRAQGSKMLELRTAMSLAQLLQKQTRQTEACDLLAPCYGAFTEGFRTRDLVEAGQLLTELRMRIQKPILLELLH